MALPEKYDLKLYRGDTRREQVKVWDDAEETIPADLTGVTFKAECRTKPGGSLLATFATSSSAPGVIDVVISAAISAALPSSGGSWDLQLTYPSGDVLTVLYGNVRITMDVTDSVATEPGSLRAVP